ncbi:MAG: hypothetical protein ABI612_06140 [Betaproteobacteria bacterium]
MKYKVDSLGRFQYEHGGFVPKKDYSLFLRPTPSVDAKADELLDIPAFLKSSELQADTKSRDLDPNHPNASLTAQEAARLARIAAACANKRPPLHRPRRLFLNIRKPT